MITIELDGPALSGWPIPCSYVQRRNSVGNSEESVHDMETYEPMIRVPECCRHSGEDRESERLPQANRVDVRLDDSVELHRDVAILRRDFQYAIC